MAIVLSPQRLLYILYLKRNLLTVFLCLKDLEIESRKIDHFREGVVFVGHPLNKDFELLKGEAH